MLVGARIDTEGVLGRIGFRVSVAADDDGNLPVLMWTMAPAGPDVLVAGIRTYHPVRGGLLALGSGKVFRSVNGGPFPLPPG